MTSHLLARLQVVHRLRSCHGRAFAVQTPSGKESGKAKAPSTSTASHPFSKPTGASKAPPPSSCPAGTLLTGVTWLKDQAPVLALPDEEYPPWLWKLLTPEKSKTPTEASPSTEEATIARRKELRRTNREKIKAQNFMKTT